MILQIIIGLLNIFYLIVMLYYMSWGTSVWWLVIPAGISAAVFYRFRKNRMLALRYANVAFLVPAGIMLFVFRLFMFPQRLTGDIVVMHRPEYYECMENCINKTGEFLNACYDNCTKWL